MKNIYLVALAVSLAGCANPWRSITDIGGGAAGAYAGHRLSGGKAGGAVAGAAAGVAVSEGAWSLADQAQKKAFREGEAKALSDSAKAIYWSQQQAQRPDAAPATDVSLYPITIPAQEIDGVHYEATTRVLRINR